MKILTDSFLEKVLLRIEQNDFIEPENDIAPDEEKIGDMSPLIKALYSECITVQAMLKEKGEHMAAKTKQLTEEEMYDSGSEFNELNLLLQGLVPSLNAQIYKEHKDKLKYKTTFGVAKGFIVVADQGTTDPLFNRFGMVKETGEA